MTDNTNTQLTSASGYNTDRMRFSKPQEGKIPDSPITFKRISISTVNDDGTTDESEGNILANSAGSYAAPTAADTTLSAFNAPVSGTANSANTGGGQAVNNMQPSLGLNYCICLQGLFPPRN